MVPLKIVSSYFTLDEYKVAAPREHSNSLKPFGMFPVIVALRS